MTVNIQYDGILQPLSEHFTINVPQKDAYLDKAH